MALISKDEFFMNKALELAEISYKNREVPVGAIIVLDDKIIATGYNQKEKTNIVSRHAELIAIENACSFLNSWRLNDTTLYTTLEPCIMCAGAIIHSRINRVVIGTRDFKTGAAGSLYDLLENNKLNHRCEVTFDILQNECSFILKKFFKEIRNNKSF
jgi:tRNA(adenine34) deaminase